MMTSIHGYKEGEHYEMKREDKGGGLGREKTCGHLLPWFKLHLEHFVGALVVVKTGLDGQVNGATQGHQVGLRLVNDLLLLCVWFGQRQKSSSAPLNFLLLFLLFID